MKYRSSGKEQWFWWYYGEVINGYVEIIIVPYDKKNHRWKQHLGECQMVEFIALEVPGNEDYGDYGIGRLITQHSLEKLW